MGSFCVLRKPEPNKLTLWVRLRNLPLEAWITKGISDVASRLGNPLIMDQTTANMCKTGYGRVGFARVLIDVEAIKGLPEKIKIVYKNRDGLITRKKSVDVNYDWSPPVCSFCKVFGHCEKNCVCRPKSVDEFMEMEREELRNKQDGTEFEQLVEKEDPKEQMVDKGSPKTGWKVQNDIIDSIRKSANKYSVLQDNDEGIRDNVEDKKDEDSDVYEEEWKRDQPITVLMDLKIAAWNIKGLVLETRLKGEKVKRIEDKCGVVYATDQAVLCMLDILSTKEKMYCYFVHAENDGRLRRRLWNDLSMFKDISNNMPMVIMGDLNDCINALKFEDVCSTGMHFTWIKSLLNPNSSILKKIDRVMGSEDFIDVHSNAHVVFLPYGISDHSPAVLTFPQHIRSKPKSFRFANYITDKEEFNQLMLEKWNINVDGFNTFKLVKKLKAIKPVLNKLNWQNGNLFEKFKELKKKLDIAQAKIDKDPHNIHLRENGVELLKEYTIALEDEEKLLFQKAKVEWLNEGDRNSAFNHKVLKGRVNRSRVEEICGEDNISIFLNKVKSNEACRMIEDITDGEIKAAMFIKEFFVKGKLLGKMNATIITLIITNRIKEVLDGIVHKNQSAFIPDRQISDNILLSQELLKVYDCKRGPKRCSIKIDIQKAYDTVDWKFLETTLRLFGFHSKMVDWIMACVSTPSYTICINGERHGFFKGGRGLRQGDPMSPYLFTRVMEVFSLTLHKKISEEPNFKYHFGCKSLKITHLSFADDLLVFSPRDVKSIKVIKSALESFSEVSGLYPNLGKSTIFYGSMKSREIEEILQILPFKRWKLPVRYLGVPLVSKKIGVKDCKRRAQLIVSVLASIQVYWASVFKLPSMVIKDIERLFKGFLWNKGELKRGKDKVTWNEVCQPKQNGGLGIKPLESWNKILLVKHLWNIATKKDTLWVQWINMVKLKGRSVWEIEKQSFTDEDTVADCISENKWRWPEEWYRKYPSLDQYAVPRLNNKTSDKLMWVSNDGCKKNFASNHVWKDLKQLNRSVKWWKVIWFSQNIPRHTFVLWMTVKGKLVTQDKLAKWYPGRIDKCPLCLKVEDSHKHLFFDCEFSSEVWENVQFLSNMKNLKDLDRSIEWIASLPCKNNIWSVVRRLCLADIVYHLWHERNTRIFQKKERSIDGITVVIKDSVKSRLMTLRVKNTSVVKSVEEKWGIKLMKK
ncbi:RNA-directed DNA polymerase, eukaryota, reverse transcriptase zinc-binding domain protein [Tanacetum coccineum]